MLDFEKKKKPEQSVCIIVGFFKISKQKALADTVHIYMTLMTFAFKTLLAEKSYGGVLTQGKLSNALSFTREDFVFLKHRLFRS